jgi:agmatine deiminase
LSFIAALSRYETVKILIPEAGSPTLWYQSILDKIGVSLERCLFIPANFSEPFLRDTGPTWVKTSHKSERKALHWTFSGWSRFAVGSGDSTIGSLVASHSGVPVICPVRQDGITGFVCEGGAIETDGAGTLMVTEECLLSHIQERNSGATREEYEAIFARWLGIQQVIWLGQGAVGDDTHGHIDDIARFIRPGAVFLSVSHNPEHVNYASSQDNLRRLSLARDASGSHIEVIELPFPDVVRLNGEIVPASYANFCFVDGAVIVPTFNVPQDEEAIRIFEHNFPDKKVETVYSTPFLYGGGTLHCLSQQEPA